MGERLEEKREWDVVESIAREQRKRMDTHDRRRIVRSEGKGRTITRREEDRNVLGKERRTRDGPMRARKREGEGEGRTEKGRERTNEGRKTNRQADSRVHRARVLLAIRALDETQSPLRSRRAAATSPALAHAGPADL